MEDELTAHADAFGKLGGIVLRPLLLRERDEVIGEFLDLRGVEQPFGRGLETKARFEGL